MVIWRVSTIAQVWCGMQPFVAHCRQFEADSRTCRVIAAFAEILGPVPLESDNTVL